MIFRNALGFVSWCPIGPVKFTGDGVSGLQFSRHDGDDDGNAHQHADDTEHDFTPLGDIRIEVRLGHNVGAFTDMISASPFVEVNIKVRPRGGRASIEGGDAQGGHSTKGGS